MRKRTQQLAGNFNQANQSLESFIMRTSRLGMGALVMGTLVLGCSSFVWAGSEGAWKESQKDAAYVGAETCASCHDDIVKRHRLSTHYGTMGPQVGPGKKDGEMKEESCESCHG